MKKSIFLYQSKCINLIGLVFLMFYHISYATSEVNQKLLADTIQDTTAYTENQSLDFKFQQKTTAQNYLKRYFSPWENPLSAFFPRGIQSSEQGLIKIFSQYPGYNSNGQLNHKDWIQQLSHNMNLDTFPNLNMNAITIRGAHVRMLPTQMPSFKSWSVGGDGYPFDNLQTSYIAANTPVRVLHTSRDGGWYLIHPAGYYGWIPSSEVAFVSSKFTKQWKNQKMLTPLQDATLPALKLSDSVTELRLGTLYPKVKVNQNSYLIYTAISNSQHQAVLKTISAPKKYLSPFPLTPNVQTLGKLANHTLNVPYGWGGLYGYRDCSATTRDLMSGIGIWLPRNSKAQITAKGGTTFSLKHLTDEEKEKKIIQHGVPFLTLLHLPGHVMMYIGEKNGTAYAYHDSWTLHGAQVSPLRIIKSNGKTLLELIDQMKILGSD